MDFSGKVAIVTGGAQGIGKAISMALLNSGMKVVICDVSESSAKKFFEDLPKSFKFNAVYKRCDVSSFEELESVFEKTKTAYGRIDVVINNAGILNEKEWERTIEINYIGVIYGIKLALEFMGKDKGGSGGFVVNTASMAGLRGFDLGPIYSSTKHAVVGLTRSFGKPYYFDKTGVTVNAVCPGMTDTSLFHALSDSTVDKEKCKEFLSNVTAINPDEIGKAVMRLLQDGKNGALIVVDDEGIRYAEGKVSPNASRKDGRKKIK